MFRRFLRPHCKNLKTVCFSSCFSLVRVELPVAGAIEFEMGVIIRFLHAEGQLVDLESHFSVFSPLISTSQVSQRSKMQFSVNSYWKGRGHPILNFQRQFDGIPSLFSVFSPWYPVLRCLRAKNAVQPNSYSKGGGHLILNFQWPVRSNF